MTLFVYAARPKRPDLAQFNYVGYATSATSNGPCHAFSRALQAMRAARFSTGRRLADLLPRPSEWEVRILELDERFEGTRREIEERRMFYMYWVARHERQVLINRRLPLAMNPTWTRTWSVVDGGDPDF